MAEDQENLSKLLSISSSQNQDSFDSWKAEAFEGDEEFYEEIEAPKFVDFTAPDHYCPDDRYWFCLRVGCDEKHEEEMDAEALYKKFVLRVMAGRSPNVRLRKALDRNASRKCPLSAPPKSSKPRLSRMAIISPITKKEVDVEEKIAKPLSKPRSTPVAKTKPVAAKYLTTPRNKKSLQSENSFRSVQNPKPTNTEVSKSRTVAKALIFHSPKKTIKVKTPVELRKPVSKLCQEMNKLEITGKPSKSLSKGCSSRQLSSHKVQRKPELPLGSRSCTNQEFKSGKSIKSIIKGKLSEQKAPKNEESPEIRQQPAQKVAEEFEPENSILEEACMPSMVPPSIQNSDLALSDDSKREGNCLEIEESNNLTSRATNMRQNNSDVKENVDHLIANNSSERERYEHVDGDNKENAAAFDENRMHNKNSKQNGRKKIFAMHDKKKVIQAHDKNLKEGPISSSPVVNLKKPKATNPKPFRLRTDERGILKEAKLDKRTHRLSPQCESTTLNTLNVKLQRKQENDIQGLKIPKRQEKSKPADAVTPESKTHRDRKPMGSLLESNAMQRLEKFRKIKSPLQKHYIRPQGLVPTKNEKTSFLIPGQKLDVIHENSPEVLELNRARKTNMPLADDAVSRSSLRGRRPITVATGPIFHNVPKTCTKKLK